MGKFKYDFEIIKEMCSSYSSKAAFMKDYPREYGFLKKQKLTDAAFSHLGFPSKMYRLFPRKMTLDERIETVRKIAKSFSNRVEFRKSRPDLDKWVMSNKCQDQVFDIYDKKKTNFSIGEIKYITKEYKTIAKFSAQNWSLYQYIKTNKLEKEAYGHMASMNKQKDLSIEEMIALSKRYPSQMHFKSAHQNLYRKIKNEKLDDKIFFHFKKTKRHFFTEEELKIRANKYNNMTEFSEAESYAVNAIYQRKLKDKLCSHMIPLIKEKYTNKELKRIALNYTTKKDFRDAEAGAYMAAFRRKLLSKICSHMQSQKNYSDDDLFDIALNYNKRSEFRKREEACYLKCYRLGILDLVCDHMKPRSSRKLDEEELRKRAENYNTRSEFEQHDRSAYYALQKRNLLQEYCSHMVNIEPISYTDEEIRKMAANFDNKRDFRSKHRKAYNEAIERKIDLDVFSHMLDGNVMEKRVLKFVQQTYPTARSKSFGKVSIKGRPYIQGFQLDIYIESLSKAVEFDGTYWHSFESLKKTKPNWPEEDVKNYHEIKDSYFKEYHGISVLHIKEKEWLENEDQCKELILKFLTS